MCIRMILEFFEKYKCPGFAPQDPVRTMFHMRYKMFYSPTVAELLDTMDSFLWEPLTPMVSKTWDMGHVC